MSAEPMSLERFRLLADAYGGAVTRWPECDRHAAERLMRDPQVRALLDEAAWLDARLDAWCVPAPSAILAKRIIGTAPTPRGLWFGQAKLWWSGLGLAAALAGATAGSFGAAVFAPPPTAGDGATAFGDLGGEGPL